MFFWRQVVPQSPEEGLKPTATPGYTRNFRDLNDKVSRGKSFSGYERNALFLNQKGNGFAEVAGLLGVDFDDDSRAVAVVDWDRDGDLDLWVTNRTAPRVRLLRNNQPSTNSFLAIRLVGNGKTTNRDAVGARLTLSSSSQPGLKQIRTVRAGDGFLAQSSSWTHFGLGKTNDDWNLRVAWPGGKVETFSGLKRNSRYTITQGQDEPNIPVVAPPPPTPMIAKQSSEAPAAPSMSGFWVANQVPFPTLSFTDEKGATRSTTDFLGKPILVNFWATWCAPCMEELGVFAKHTDELRALGATVLALNVDGLALDGSASAAANVEEVLARAGYRLPHGIANQANLAKIEILLEYLTSRQSPLSIPASFLVDAKGNVAAVYREPVQWEQLARDFALLDASPEAQLMRASPRPGRWVTDPRKAVDRAALLGDYATLFATNGFPKESQRLYQMMGAKAGSRSAPEFYNLAKSAAQQGSEKRAEELYRTAIRLDPEFGQALTGLGALLLKQKKIVEAQRLFEQALSIDPNHATALINLAMIDQSQGNNEIALQRLLRVVARNPDFAQAQLNLGSLLASMKKFDEAIQHLSKAVELNPKMVPAHINLAVAYTQTKQWEKAEGQYRKVHQLSPRMAAFSHFGLGNVFAGQQRHADAVASYRKAISLGANNPQTFTQLGLSLLELGEKQVGIEALKQALKLDPNYKAAKQTLRENSVVQ